MRIAVFTALLATACATVPLAGEPAPSPWVEPPIAPALPTAFTPTMAEVVVPADAPCVMTGALAWGPLLRLTRDGQPFAGGADATRIRVHVPADPVATGLVVQIESGPIELAAVVAPNDLELYARDPMLLGGLFSPSGRTELTVAGVSGRELQVALPIPPLNIDDWMVPLVANVRCDRMSLVPTRLDASRALGPALKSTGLAGRGIPLSRSASADPVATLSRGVREATVLVREERFSRVAWPSRGGLMSAWVPNDALGGGELGIPEVRSVVLRHRKWPEPNAPEQRVCRHPVRLGATMDDTAAWVGTIRPGTAIEVEGASALDVLHWASVRIPDLEMRLAIGAELIVARSALADCATTRADDRELAISAAEPSSDTRPASPRGPT